MGRFYIYLIVCAVVTYAVRAIPLILVNKKITNGFVLSFLHYIPTAILSVMTIPAIFSATGNKLSSIAGFIGAIILAYKGKSLMIVAIGASASVLIVELLLRVL